MASVACTEQGESGVAYELTPGTRVRAESTGLLFYQRRGPRLFYLSCGQLLDPEFFSSGVALHAWLHGKELPSATVESLERALSALQNKGVVRACKGGPPGALGAS